LAAFLLVLWLGTVAVAYLIGSGQFVSDGDSEPMPAIERGGSLAQVAPRQAAVEPVPTPTNRGTPPPALVSSGSAEGEWVLQLRSVAKRSTAADNEFETMVERLNGQARSAGLRPLFGLRYPRSGGIAFVYGQVGNAFGVDRDSDEMKQIDTHLASVFPDRRWVRVTP
jgi:hypothetical protein